MTNIKPQENAWDPHTRVSFPRRTEATVQFEHDGVQFATVQCLEGDFLVIYPPVAYFVQDQKHIPWGGWHRITKADYEMILDRCKADPTSKLCVASWTGHRLYFVFRPAEVDTTGFSTEQLVEDEERVTFIKAQILAGWDDIEEELASA